MPEEEDEVDACHMAMEAALNKGAEFCGTQEARLEVLGQIAGVDGESLDPEEALDGGPGTNPIEQREWVVARAEQKMDAGEDPFDALQSAWTEVDDEVGGEVDEDPDDGEEEEAEDNDPIEVDGEEYENPDPDDLESVLDDEEGDETPETGPETGTETEAEPETDAETDPEPVDAD